MDLSVVAGEWPCEGLVQRELLRVRGRSAGYCAEGATSGSLTVRGRLLTDREGLCDLLRKTPREKYLQQRFVEVAYLCMQEYRCTVDPEHEYGQSHRP